MSSAPSARACLFVFLATIVVALLGKVPKAVGQGSGERTLEEVKEEALKRAENGMYPMIGLDPADVREAFRSIHKMDNDEWAAAFMKVADGYMAEGKSLEASDPAKASAAYIRAWRLYSFGRWPVPASAGKKESYAKALEAFRAASKTFDPPLETVRIPFKGKEIVGYLRLPKGAGAPVPVLLAISGLDSRKEDMSMNYGAILEYGIGFLAIDYLLTRPEVDKARIAVVGQSFGGYWAAKLAIVEHDRLRAVVAQSPPVDGAFQKDYVLNKLHGNREYLFGMVSAMAAILDNAKSETDVAEQFPKLSLVNQGLIGKPTAPMLIVAGVLDTQVPVADAYLLLNNGDVPKEAWINPKGGHLGRQVKVYPDPVILRTVIVPWLVRKLGMEDAPKAAQ